jgi:hypothetical protein
VAAGEAEMIDRTHHRRRLPGAFRPGRDQGKQIWVPAPPVDSAGAVELRTPVWYWADVAWEVGVGPRPGAPCRAEIGRESLAPILSKIGFWHD